MALLFCESFDHYTTLTQKWEVAVAYGGAAYPSIGGSYGRFSTSGCYMPTDPASGNICRLEKTLAVGSSGVIGFAYYVGGATSPSTSFGPLLLYDAGTLHLQLVVTQSSPQILSVYRAGSLLGSGTVGMTVGTWNYVEFSFTIHSSLGAYSLRINGVSSVSGSSVNTRNGGTGLIDVVDWRGVSGSGYYLDDIYILSGTGAPNSFLGDSRVTSLFPNAVGTYTDFARGGADSGTNWGQVDESPPNDATDYVQSSTLAATDTYGVPDLSSNYFSIGGVQVTARMTKADAGTRALALVARSGGNDYFSSNYYLGAGSWLSRTYPWGVNPDTGIAWTIDEINAAEFGVKVAV